MKNANTHSPQEKEEHRGTKGGREGGQGGVRKRGKGKEEDKILFLGTLLKGERIWSDISVSPRYRALRRTPD